MGPSDEERATRDATELWDTPLDEGDQPFVNPLGRQEPPLQGVGTWRDETPPPNPGIVQGNLDIDEAAIIRTLTWMIALTITAVICGAIGVVGYAFLKWLADVL